MGGVGFVLSIPAGGNFPAAAGCSSTTCIASLLFLASQWVRRMVRIKLRLLSVVACVACALCRAHKTKKGKRSSTSINLGNKAVVLGCKHAVNHSCSDDELRVMPMYFAMMMHFYPYALLILFLRRSEAAAKEVSSAPKLHVPLTFRTELLKDETGAVAGRTHQVFKILQLADIHYGEGPGTNWGERQDAKSIELIQSLLQSEAPDLVVLSGDQLTADFIKEGATSIQQELVQTMVDSQPNVRWCLVMGNHDDHPHETYLHNGDLVLTDATTTRRDLLYFDASLEGSVTVAGEKSMYRLPIFYETDGDDERDTGSPAAEIFIFDTGGGMIREEIDQEQVDWFVEQIDTTSTSHPIPAIAFQHIVSNEGAWTFGEDCSGVDEESNKVKTVKNDPGLFDAMIAYEDLHFVGVGHNHGKSYCCDYQDLHLCYGRHSGYGGYEKVDRGGRIYELKMEVVEENQIVAWDWESWVRLEDGSVVDRYRPNDAKEYPLPPVQTRTPTHAPSLRPTIVDVDTFAPSKDFTESPSVGETYQSSLSPSAAPSRDDAVAESTLSPIVHHSGKTQLPTGAFALPSSGGMLDCGTCTSMLFTIGLGHVLLILL